mgnify:CR=1 FL=1
MTVKEMRKALQKLERQGYKNYEVETMEQEDGDCVHNRIWGPEVAEKYDGCIVWMRTWPTKKEQAALIRSILI